MSELQSAFESSAEFARLLERIAAKPVAKEPWAVLADALSDQNHPRGELIAIDLKLEELQLDPEFRLTLRKRRAELMQAHADLFLGQERLLGDFFLEWKRGFIRKAVSPSVAVHPDCLSALWQHPSAALMESLELSYDEAPVLFVGQLPSLKTLHLHPRKANAERSLAPLLEKACPSLEWLHLTSPAEDLRHLRHSRLHALEISESGFLFGTGFAARFPSLKSLSLFGVSSREDLAEPTGLVGGDVPKTLKHLSLGALALSGAVLRELAVIVRSTAIERLDLSGSQLSPLGVRAFFELLQSLPKLKAFAPPFYHLVPTRMHGDLKKAEQQYRLRQKKKTVSKVKTARS